MFASETVVQYEMAHLFTSEVDELLGVQGAGQCGNTQRVPENIWAAECAWISAQLLVCRRTEIGLIWHLMSSHSQRERDD